MCSLPTARGRQTNTVVACVPFPQLEADRQTQWWRVFPSHRFIIVMVYYGLTLNITNLSGNIYSNFAVNIAFEVLAYIAPYLLLDRVGRKPVYCASILLAGASCVMAVLPVLLAAPGQSVSGVCVCVCVCVSV